MTMRTTLTNVFLQEDINFLLTNRIPRRLLTRFMGWFSKIEQPLVRDASIALWQLFSDLDLSEARRKQFKSVHDCFTRELKDGARPIDCDPQVVVSPCAAIIGAHGRIAGTELLQIKGFTYSLSDFLGSPLLVERHRDGLYVTLRLTSSMYHRFHAPHDSLVERVTYISGDTWNVNPIALQRIEKLFCKNERAVLELKLDRVGGGDDAVGPRCRSIALVPVAAILVASMKFHCLPRPLDLRYRGPHRIPCSAAYRRGEEMGYFQQGSTIIVFATAGYRLADGVTTGTRVAMGQALLTEQS